MLGLGPWENEKQGQARDPGPQPEKAVPAGC